MSELPAVLDRYVIPEPNSGCWIWMGALDWDEYGIAWDARTKKNARAHRLVHEYLVGPVPQDKKLLHRCDMPWCVNPEHMFVGTIADNNRDCKQKGRNAKGTGHGRNKLTEAQVLEIRASTEPQRRIAKRYGVSQPLITFIKTRRLWKELEE